VDVDLSEVPLDTALKKLAQGTGVQIVFDPKLGKEAHAPVSLRVDDVPLEAAVRLLTNLAGLKPYRMGNIVYITTKERFAELKAEPDLVPRPRIGQPGGPVEDVITVPGGGRVVPGGPRLPVSY
jgi:type II secretory pathway component HofQ